MATVSAKVNLSNNIFSDFDFNFARIPATGDIAKKNNAEAIKQSIKNILLTSNFERPFQPDFGSQINKLLFSLWTPLSKLSLQRVIEDAINNYEPRVKLISIEIQDRSQNNAIDVNINFIIRNVNTQVTMSLTLEKLR